MLRIKEWLRMRDKQAVYFVVGLLILSCVYLFFHRTPKDFPLGQIITIESGQSLQQISNTLYDARIVKHPFIFRVHVILQGGEKKIWAGDYLLDKREGPADLAYRMVRGHFHLDPVKATIPEGWNIYQIAEHLDKNLISFDKKVFISMAKSKEGYLFPDTYFLSPTIKPEAIISLMQDNFSEKIASISGIATSTKKFGDIITMASILEAEAVTMESRRVVAGILWKRLDLGMALQADSTFLYINGKNTYELTASDLKIDSPYNTYRYAGLPPTPINNPGTDSILAAISPIKTDYLYFLSSKSGDMYYAKTFEEHKLNKQRYLK